MHMDICKDLHNPFKIFSFGCFIVSFRVLLLTFDYNDSININILEGGMGFRESYEFCHSQVR